MYKKIFLVLCWGSLSLFLTACGKDETIIQTEKKDFFVDTILGSNLQNQFFLEKTGKVRSSQDILLSANAQGRVVSLLVKSGDNVQAGQLLATLEDNVGNYSLNLERAENALERSKINYESTRIQGEKQIMDAQTYLETLRRNLSTLEKDSEQTLIQAKDALENSKYGEMDSTTALQLKQLEVSIAKSELDYENKKIVDQEVLSGYEASLQTQFNSFVMILQDVTQMSDTILGVSAANRSKNDNYEDLLGAKDRTQKKQSEVGLQELLTLRDSQTIKDYQNTFLQTESLSISQMQEIINFLETSYEKIKIHINALEITVSNSLTSVGQLSEGDIIGFQTNINASQNILQSSYAGYISFSSSVKSFLKTFDTTQKSLLQALELQKQEKDILIKKFQSGELSANVNYEKTLLGINNSIEDLKTQILSAERNLENAKKMHDISLKTLENAIREGEISMKTALKEFSKLSITSPINGTVSEILVDKGQEITLGKPLFNILSDNTPEIEIAFNQKEKNIVALGQKGHIEASGEKIEGTIYSISDIADENLNYKSTLVFTSGTNIIGDVVQVKIPIDGQKKLLPLESVQTKGGNEGYIFTLSGQTLETTNVRLGDIYNNYVELLSCEGGCENYKIVLSDVSNYDENNFTLLENK